MKKKVKFENGKIGDVSYNAIVEGFNQKGNFVRTYRKYTEDRQKYFDLIREWYVLNDEGKKTKCIVYEIKGEDGFQPTMKFEWQYLGDQVTEIVYENRLQKTDFGYRDSWVEIKRDTYAAKDR
jgi:hypothetical protein